MKQLFRILLMGLWIVMLSACGGGSDDDTTPAISTATSNTSTTNTHATLVLDVEQKQLEANWQEELGINGDFVQITQNGDYGTFSFSGDTIYYSKRSETNATDRCLFEVLLESGDIQPLTIEVKSLYWRIAKAGANHTVALKSDGTIWSWGYNNNGELGDGTTTNRLTKVQEASHSSDWKMVDAGAWTTVAIKEDGSLWAWGHNDLGQLGDGTTDDSLVPKKIAEGDWTHISMRDSHVLALQSDGSLWAWGSNVGGSIGNGDTSLQLTPYKIAGRWKEISAGENFSVAINDEGRLYAWGDNTLGALGVGDKDDRLTPTSIVAQGDLFNDWDLSDFVMVSAGDNHVLAIQENGTIWGWGNNGFGQLTNNSDGTDEQLTPIKIDLVDAILISAGAEYSMGIYGDGTMRGWGDSQYGTIGADTWEVTVKFPTQESTQSTHWIGVDAGVVHTVAIDAYGQLWIWGTNEYGELGDGTSTSTATPKKIYGRAL